MYDLAASPIDAPDTGWQQHLVATGNDVFLSLDATAWRTGRTGVPDAGNIVSAPDGRFFVATRGGKGYRSMNDGNDWSELSIGGDDDPVRFLAASPDFLNEPEAYAITIEDGQLYRTEDSGSSWAAIVVDLEQPHFSAALAYSPVVAFDKTAFLGTDRGIYHTTDDGRSWELRVGPAAGPSAGPRFGPEGGELRHQGILLPAEWGDDMRRKGDPIVRAMFAWNESGVWQSDDDAATWRKLPVPAAIETVHHLAASPGFPADPLLLVTGAGVGIVGAVSTDGGGTWRTIATDDPGLVGTRGAFARAFVPLPVKDIIPPRKDPSMVHNSFLPIMWMSPLRVPTPIPGQPLPTPTYLAVPTVPVQREVYLATDGSGVWRSTDDGSSWQRPYDALPNGGPTCVTFLSGDGQLLLAGTEAAGLYRSSDGGATWSRLDGALPRGEGERIQAIEPSPAFDSDRTVFATTASGVWVSRDGGTAWQRTAGPAPARTLAVSPDFANDRTVLVDGWLSTDGGATWNATAARDTFPWRAVAFSPRYAQDRTIWAGTDAVGRLLPNHLGLYRSTDGGGSWAQIDDNLLLDRGVFSLALLSASSAEPVRVFVGTSNGLIRSIDDGGTWQGVNTFSGQVIGGLDSIVLTRIEFGIVAVASARGVGWSTDRGLNWTLAADGPKTVSRVTLAPDGQHVVVTTRLTLARRQIPDVPAD